MADNRMWLVHDATHQRVLLAKYSPSGGWVTFGDVDARISAAFEKVDFPDGMDEQPAGLDGLSASVGGQCGDTGWRIEYEINDTNARQHSERETAPSENRS